MMHAQEKMTNLDANVILSLQTSAMTGDRNVLTIYSDGLATKSFDGGKGDSHSSFQTKLDLANNATAEDYVKANLPAESFLALNDTYYEIPSNMSCGTAANLFLRIGEKEHWLGIWNFGRGDIPAEMDAGMYQAVVGLAESLN